MKKMTLGEIKNDLLTGKKVEWIGNNGSSENIELTKPKQRSLFSYILNSSVRSLDKIDDTFIEGLSRTYQKDDVLIQDNDTNNETTNDKHHWHLQKIETVGFGGINFDNTSIFSYEFNGESILFQGQNGSGKSSLIGAIIWAITGKRPRDHNENTPEEDCDVYDENNNKYKNKWPPIATYPKNVSDLQKKPTVCVTLTFINELKQTAIIERRLENELITHTCDPKLNFPDIFIETGVLMPSRMPLLRFDANQTPLTNAVQALTGLDELSDIGNLVANLCHTGRIYLKQYKEKAEQYKKLFGDNIKEAERALTNIGQHLVEFEIEDTIDENSAFYQTYRKFQTDMIDKTQTIKDDINAQFDLKNIDNQTKLTAMIVNARESLNLGLTSLKTWENLSNLSVVLTPQVAQQLQQDITTAKQALTDAKNYHEQAQKDTRFQLKALGAHWHQEHHPDDALIDCPLCEKTLNENLKAQLEQLRNAGVAATRQFNDNLNAIKLNLEASVPSSLRPLLSYFATCEPRAALINDIEHKLIKNGNIENTLIKFVTLVKEALKTAPSPALDANQANDDASTNDNQIYKKIFEIEKLSKILTWFNDNKNGWETWWKSISDEQEQVSTTDETLTQHLKRLLSAVNEAKPYQNIVSALKNALNNGQEAHKYKTLQDERENIAELLRPLKDLEKCAHAQARLAIDTLSNDIMNILEYMKYSLGLIFKRTSFNKKKGIQIQGGFSEEINIDATLVANTSWLRAVLWAFLFALRKNAVEQHGSDPMPLLLLDDPQATFDSEHRGAWADIICKLQQDVPQMQIVLATHDNHFKALLIQFHNIQGIDATIENYPTSEHIQILEGNSLERKWNEIKNNNNHEEARDYICKVRKYIEKMLRIMLQGELPYVNDPSEGTILGKACTAIKNLHNDGKGSPPWNNSEFKKLVNLLNKDDQNIKIIQKVNHPGDEDIYFRDAVKIEKFWTDKLKKQLYRAFYLKKEWLGIHGNLNALNVDEPSCELPEGYSDTLKNKKFEIIGKAAAITSGASPNNEVDFQVYDENEKNDKPFTLGLHSAYRLQAPTLEPVARKGDILIVHHNIKQPSLKSLVVARYNDKIVARRYDIADNHKDIAVLTAQAINPRQIADPIIAQKSALKLQKVVGIFYDHISNPKMTFQEVDDCNGDAVLKQFQKAIKGLIEVKGDSAEPIALNKQFLMIGEAVSPEDALTHYINEPVIARDENGNEYIKRLRKGGSNTVVLESLNMSGDYVPIILTLNTNTSTDIQKVWPILGVLFER